MSLENNIKPIFQGGAVRRITVGATAGNVITNLTPAGGAFKYKRWRFLRGRITLVCDATVANRFFTIIITDGTNVVETLITAPPMVALSTTSLEIGEVTIASALSMLGNNGYYLGVQNLFLEGSDQFRIQIGAGVAGDSYNGFFEVLETVI